MRIPTKRGEKGFTLIELLIVVAILGVLAAVVIPNVGRFIGRGEEEAAETEFANIQAAVHAMMVDNEMAYLPNAVSGEANRTQNMAAFPDSTSAPETDKLLDILGNAYDSSDKAGFLLYSHDRVADSSSVNLTNYTATQYTSQWYIVDASGTVTQYTEAAP